MVGHGRERRAPTCRNPASSPVAQETYLFSLSYSGGGGAKRGGRPGPPCAPSPPRECPTARALAGWPPRVASEKMETRLRISQQPPLFPAPPVCFPATPPRHPPRAGETLAKLQPSHVTRTLRPPSLPQTTLPVARPPSLPPHPAHGTPTPRGRATPPAKCVLPRPPREADPSPVALQVQSTGAPPRRVPEGGDGDTKTRLPESFPRHQPPPMRRRCPRHGGGPRTPCPAGLRRHQELRTCTCGIFAKTGVGVPHPSCAPPWSRRKV